MPPSEKLTILDPLPNEGLSIPLRASFFGIKAIPLLALGHNSLSPLLILFEDHLECRVMRKRRKEYSQIEHLDIFQTFKTQNLTIIWKDSLFTFTGNVRDEDSLRKLLQFFEGKGMPLSEKARQLLESEPKL